MEMNTPECMVLFNLMKIGFVSRGNAIRSLFAEAIARQITRAVGIKAEIFSAGVDPENEPHQLTLKVLVDKKFPTHDLTPKGLEAIPYEDLDILVTIGEEAKDKCEFIPGHKRREVWLIYEPKGGIDSFLKVFEEVEKGVLSLLKL